jgi:hypothetical protein
MLSGAVTPHPGVRAGAQPDEVPARVSSRHE